MLIKKFKTDDHYYIYDSLSSNILQVSKVIYDIIDKHENELESEIIAKFNNIYREDIIKKALKQIETCVEDGTIENNKPLGMQSVLDRESVENSLSNELSTLTLEVTQQCNLRCSYCVFSGAYKNNRRHRPKYMDFDVAKKAIDYFIQHSRNSTKPLALSFYGGEPLLSFDLVKQCVSYFKKKHNDNCIFSLTTNGTLINNETIDFFVANNFNLIISLDGPEEIQDKYRVFADNTGTFDHVLPKLEAIKQLNAEYYENMVTVSVVMNPPVDIQLLDNFFSKLGTKVHSTVVQAYGTDNHENFQDDINNSTGFSKLREKFKKAAIDDNLLSKEIRFVRDLFLKSIEKIHNRNTKPVDSQDFLTFKPCLPGAHKLFVSVEGNFYTCERINGDLMCIGDINNGINYEKAYEITRKFSKLKEKHCKNCWLVRLCDICYFHTVEGSTWDEEKMSHYCSLNKKHYARVLSIYCSIMEKNQDAFYCIEDM